MRQRNEVIDRIEDLESNLSVLAEARSRELEKPFQSRDPGYLEFITREQTMYSFALTQCKWLLGDSVAGSEHDINDAILRIRDAEPVPGSRPEDLSAREKKSGKINILTWGGMGDA